MLEMGGEELLEIGGRGGICWRWEGRGGTFGYGRGGTCWRLEGRDMLEMGGEGHVGDGRGGTYWRWEGRDMLEMGGEGHVGEDVGAGNSTALGSLMSLLVLMYRAQIRTHMLSPGLHYTAPPPLVTGRLRTDRVIHVGANWCSFVPNSGH
ncbi:hypothetical protein ACOMHN_030004 [Nucella lapillus]